jgi:hypothetical protein
MYMLSDGRTPFTVPGVRPVGHWKRHRPRQISNEQTTDLMREQGLPEEEAKIVRDVNLA